MALDTAVAEAMAHRFGQLGKAGWEIVALDGTDKERLELLRLAGDDCTSDSGIDRVMAEILVNHYRGIFEAVRVRNTSPLGA